MSINPDYVHAPQMIPLDDNILTEVKSDGYIKLGSSAIEDIIWSDAATSLMFNGNANCKYLSGIQHSY